MSGSMAFQRVQRICWASDAVERGHAVRCTVDAMNLGCAAASANVELRRLLSSWPSRGCHVMVERRRWRWHVCCSGEAYLDYVS